MNESVLPSAKDPTLTEFIDNASQLMFGRTRTESIQQNVCVTCGKMATGFSDASSRKEYTISGMCQVCQDETFEEDI